MISAGPGRHTAGDTDSATSGKPLRAAKNEAPDALPRLAYICDVPIVETVAGPLQLHRLLSGYESARLLAIGGNIDPAGPLGRLPGVEYREIRYAPDRLLRSRLSPYCSLGLAELTPWLTSRLVAELKRWHAEAVLTIPHGYLWRAAVGAARRLGLPLHLIVHDDWPTLIGPPWAQARYRTMFREALRSASSVLCVSPYMVEAYERDYGVRGSTLYPIRGAASGEPRVRVRDTSEPGPFTIAYAGSLWGGQYVEMLRHVANLLAEMGGRLNIYGRLSAAELAAAGLGGPNITAGGFLPFDELAERVGATADALFLPMSFLPQDRATASVAFPSKLTEYTVIGLPIVIWGPDYCSAVRWASESGDVAICATEFDLEAMRSVLRRIAADSELRRDLASRSVAAGNRDFALETGRRVLYGALVSAECGRVS